MTKQPNRYTKKIYELAGRSLYFPPFIVALVVLSVTLLPWQNARHNLLSSQQKAIDSKTKSVEAVIQNKFNDYENKLSSGVALMRANQDVTKQQWQDFFNTSATTENIADNEIIGYLKVFEKQNKSEIEQFAMSQGYKDFYIHPDTPGDQLSSSVIFVHPLSNNNMSTVGLNMLAQNDTKEAAMRAITTASPALSKLSESDSDSSYGDESLIMLVPNFANKTKNVTQEQRRQNLQGYVYTQFQPSQLLDELLQSQSRQQHFSLQVYSEEIKPSNLLYQTNNYNDIEGDERNSKTTRGVSLFGATWKMSYQFDDKYVVSTSERSAPTVVIAIGMTLSMLVFLATLSFFKRRTKELQEQKDAEVDLAKDELLSLASHQMRTPATGVKQYVGMVLQGFAGEVDPAQRLLLEKAYDGNERQLHVINQILQLAKLESGRIVLAKHPTDLKKLIEDVVEEQQAVASEVGHSLKAVVPKQPLMAKIDQHMIRMVLENIVSNALKYTLKAGTITVKLTQNKQYAIIAIADTGIGIAENKKEEIFKQFTRLHTNQTAGVSGTGIGLYLANQLVNLHGGTIELTSTEGKGTTFIIKLPKRQMKIKPSSSNISN